MGPEGNLLQTGGLVHVIAAGRRLCPGEIQRTELPPLQDLASRPLKGASSQIRLYDKVIR
jgi:hypothetical protein